MFRADWRFLTVRLLWPSLLASLATSGLQIVLTNLIKSSKAEQYQQIGYDCGWLLLVCFVLAISQWIVALRATAIYRVVFGIDSDFQAAMKYASRRKWAVFSLFTFGSLIPLFVTFCVILVFLLIFVLKGLGSVWQLLALPIAFLGGLFIVLGTAISILIATLLFAAVSSEDKSLGRIFKMSFELGLRYPMRGGSFVCLFLVSLIPVLFACSFFIVPFEVYETYLVTRASSLDDWPFYLRVLETVSQTINNIISMSLTIISSGLYFRDVQFRFAGTDLLERLSNLESKSD